jgi:hypothetical protein
VVEQCAQLKVKATPTVSWLVEFGVGSPPPTYHPTLAPAQHHLPHTHQEIVTRMAAAGIEVTMGQASSKIQAFNKKREKAAAERAAARLSGSGAGEEEPAGSGGGTGSSDDDSDDDDGVGAAGRLRKRPTW